MDFWDSFEHVNKKLMYPPTKFSKIRIGPFSQGQTVSTEKLIEKNKFKGETI